MTAHVDTFARDNLPPREQWPELIFDLPQLQYPERLNCAGELLDAMVAAGHGERIAIRTQYGACSYRQLLVLANRIAHVLQGELKLVPGNRVLLRGPNNLMMSASWFAVIKAGCIAVATMPLLRAGELQPIIDKAQIGAALCDTRLLDELRLAQAKCPQLTQVVAFNDGQAESLEARLAGKPETFANVDTALDDVALIAFTSGTTGQPKGTLHFHRDVMAMCDCFPRSILEPTADGYFFYQARSDDMIISAGYNIAGPEVEDALLKHPAVAECGGVGVTECGGVGVADEARGQVVKAFVVLRPGFAGGAALVTELQDFVKAAIAPYKYPRAIEFIAALPRTETGKLQRFRLREAPQRNPPGSA